MTGEKEKARRLSALFLLGGILFSYPAVSLFNLRVLFFGIPLLYFYIFSVWILIILLIAMATRQGSRSTGNRFPV